uniref:Uncharacterized protein n=1 Tax=Pseudodiaptomus poplesia TaxID=213370 RepID=A0A1S6GLA5_9MAXI|nr:hypothetical protein [Pseudodiaptomus poplesia]
MNRQIIRAEIYSDDETPKGNSMTLTEIGEEDGKSWTNLPSDIIIRALRSLEKEKKAEIFDNGDGVKFF